ncbi:MAG: adenylate/guanylate cyclase domain-containing protein, partial [Hyphomicrobiaceae bacterium]
MPTETSGRKLTTLLAADVAGYSRLTSLDEEVTIAALRKHRTELIDPLLDRYGGRIANTAGDSVLIEFPSVVDAFRCAFEVQAGMVVRNAGLPPDKRIEFRIGINVGDVLIDGDDLLGDGVNVAARLEGMAKPGGICISGSARDQIHHLLNIQLYDLGEIRVKNIERPVRAFQVVLDGQEHSQPHALRQLRKHRKVLAGLAFLIIILAATAYWLGGSPGSLVNPSNSGQDIANPKTLRPTLIVLPFTNISNDPEQEYFSDGITEGLTTALARTPGLLVSARNTAFTFKGKPVNVRDLQDQLGVRYVLEGSARKLGDRLRLSAQLIEASTSTHLWAETFDRPLKDIFIVQDDLV